MPTTLWYMLYATLASRYTQHFTSTTREKQNHQNLHRPRSDNARCRLISLEESNFVDSLGVAEPSAQDLFDDGDLVPYTMANKGSVNIKSTRLGPK